MTDRTESHEPREIEENDHPSSLRATIIVFAVVEALAIGGFVYLILNRGSAP